MKLHVNEHLIKKIVSLSLAGTMMFSLSSCSSRNPNYKSYFFGLKVDLSGDFDKYSLNNSIIYYYYDNHELKFSILKTNSENDLFNVVDFTNNKVLLSLDNDDCIKLKKIEKMYNYDSKDSMHFLVSLIYDNEIVDSEPFSRYMSLLHGNKSTYTALEVQNTIDYLYENKEENFKALEKKYYSYRNKVKQD